ncbi:hypothetical protein PMAYCL1PPCAC_03185, partial [Pristionchus mayeri]
TVITASTGSSNSTFFAIVFIYFRMKAEICSGVKISASTRIFARSLFPRRISNDHLLSWMKESSCRRPIIRLISAINRKF